MENKQNKTIKDLDSLHYGCKSSPSILYEMFKLGSLKTKVEIWEAFNSWNRLLLHFARTRQAFSQRNKIRSAGKHGSVEIGLAADSR